jgi:broad specificity phosphatase PhoE
MANPRLVLIRHGATVDNKRGRLMGRNDAPLAEEAVANARKLGQSPQLKRLLEPTERVWASPLPRAFETARLITEGSDVAIDPAEALIERDFGIYSGRILDDLWKSADPEWKAAEGDYDVRPKDGESLADVEARVFPFIVHLDEIVPRDQNLILVGHSTVWRLVTAALNQRRKFPLEEKIAGPLSIQEYDRSVVQRLWPLLAELSAISED